MEEISVTINIAGRSYSISVPPSQEELVIAAGKMIKEKLQEYAGSFSIRDNQDALAMFALELATEYQRSVGRHTGTDAAIEQEILEIKKLLSQAD